LEPIGDSREQWDLGLGDVWRRGRSRQAIAAETVALERVRLAVWIVSPGGGCIMIDS